MKPAVRIAATLVIVATGVIGGTSAAAACSGPSPTLDQVVNRAEYIVLATVTSHTPVVGAPDRWEMRVDQTLKGTTSDVIHIANAKVGICSDDLVAGIGRQLVLAHGISFEGFSIDAYVSFNGDNVAHATSFAEFTRPATLADVLAALRAKLPDTATADSPAATDDMLPLIAYSLALAVGGWLTLQLRSRRVPRKWLS